MFAEAGGEAQAFQGPIVTRAGQGVVYRGLAFCYEFLGTKAAGKQMNPVLGTVHARRIEGPEDYARHEGEEFVYVLSGAVEVYFETGEMVQLAKGDRSTSTAGSATPTSAPAGNWPGRWGLAPAKAI